MMKKLYMVATIVFTVAVCGCTIKVPMPDGTGLTGAELTGTEMSGEILSWIDSAMEEFTGEFDAEEVPMAEGSEKIDTNTGTIAETKNLIDERANQPKDDTKLTEEDIDLMQKIMDRVESLGK